MQVFQSVKKEVWTIILINVYTFLFSEGFSSWVILVNKTVTKYVYNLKFFKHAKLQDTMNSLKLWIKVIICVELSWLLIFKISFPDLKFAFKVNML